MECCGHLVQAIPIQWLCRDGDLVKTTRCERRRGRFGVSTLVALCAWLSLAAWSASVRAEAIEVSALALPFNHSAPLEQGGGRLAYRGGLELRSDAAAFGGFSAARVSADGRRLIALSDRGTWLSATLDYDGEGRLKGVHGAHLAAMKPPPGKVMFDPEGLALAGDGALIVSTERNHRLLRYAATKDGRADPFALDADALAEVTPRVLPVPPDFAAMAPNSGIEALERLPDERLLAIEEGREDAGAAVSRVWLIRADGTSDRLALNRSANFRPTDAASLPDGDVLVLERRYTKIGGVAARLRLIPSAALKPGATLDGEIIASLIPPVTVDNMEALAVYRAANGELRLLMMSDDNFNAGLQRTLLLQFALEPAAHK